MSEDSDGGTSSGSRAYKCPSDEDINLRSPKLPRAKQDFRENSALFNFKKHEGADECLEPWRYLCTLPGKNIRSQLIDAFQVWLQIPVEVVTPIKQIVGFLHNASLLVDDIEDNSKLRRGKPVAHAIFGVPNTLNCANYVYFLALEKCLELQSAEAVAFMTSELLNLHRGQGRDIVWRDSGKCPQISEYLAMILDKTGGLFRLAVGLMKCFSDNDEDYTELVNMMAIYFQVRDDLINLANTKYHKNKSFCEDITEGKFSFPMIHGIYNSPVGDTRLLTILKQRTEDKDIKLCAVSYLRDVTKSFVYTRDYLEELKQKIMKELNRLGGHPQIEKLMALLELEVIECQCDSAK